MQIRVLVSFVLSALLAIAPLSAAMAATAVHAADPRVTWGVVPANTQGPDSRYSFAYAVSSGRLIHDQVAILNTGTVSATFKLYAANAITDFETGAFGLQDSAKRASDLGSWVHLSQDSVTVSPGRAVVVPFQVAVPTNAPPGDHAAGIIASITTNSTNSKGAGINLEQRVGAALYVRVAGDAAAAVQVAGLVVSYSGSWNPFSSGDTTVDYQVKNSGNARMDVAQDIVLKGPFGIPLGHVSNVKPVLNLLPGQSTHSRAKVSGIPALFLLFADVTLAPGPPTDSLAKSAEQNFDGTPAATRPPLAYLPVNSETLTGAVPWLLVLLILVVFAAIWLLARYIQNSQIRMYDAIDQAAEEAREEALEEAGAGRGRDSAT